MMAYKKNHNKKAQVWLSDYIIGGMLFTLAVLIAVKIILNSFQSDTVFAEMKADATKISEIFLSEGYPADWPNQNLTNLIRPGLLSFKRLDDSKIVKAMNMSINNYTFLRSKLQTKYDFLTVFEQPGSDIIEFNNFCYIGKSGNINLTNMPSLDCHNVVFSESYTNLIKINRFIIYNSTIVRMEVYVWD